MNSGNERQLFRKQRKKVGSEANRSIASSGLESSQQLRGGIHNNFKIVQELMDEIDQFYAVHQIVQRMYECFFLKQREILLDKFNIKLEQLWSKVERLQHYLTDLSFLFRKRKTRQIDLRQELRFKQEEIEELKVKKGQISYYFDRETKQNYMSKEEKSILPRISREFESFQRQILRDITEKQNK